MAELLCAETDSRVVTWVGVAGSDGVARRLGDWTPASTRTRRSCSMHAALALLATAALAGVLLLLGASVRPPIEAAGLGAEDGLPKAAGLVAPGVDPGREAEWGSCAVDADQAASGLAQAVVLLRNATRSCPRAEGRGGHSAARAGQQSGLRACAVDASLAVDSAAWTAAYVAAAVKSCAARERFLRRVHAACASSLTELVAELGDVAVVAGAVADACEQEEGRKMHRDPQGERRLRQERRPLAQAPFQQRSPTEELQLLEERADAMKEAARERKERSEEEEREGSRHGLRPAQCVLDLDLGAGFLARAGLQIYWLRRECPLSTKRDLKHCSLDVFSVISSVAWAARSLSQIALDCPDVARSKGACGAMVANFVAIAAALGPLVSGVTDHCPSIPLLDRSSLNGTGTLTLPTRDAQLDY